MPNRLRIVLRGAGLLVPAFALLGSSRADDFSRFLKRAAGDTLRQALVPQAPQGPVPSAARRQAQGPAMAPGTSPAPVPAQAQASVPSRVQARAEHGEPLAIR